MPTSQPKIQERIITQSELVQALARILSYKAPIKEEEREGIEEKVSNKSIQESRLRIIETSDVWKQHAKTHKDAHLMVIEPTRPPENIRQMLTGELEPYATKRATEHVSYGTAKASQGVTYAERSQTITGGNGYVHANHPSRPDFFAGCPCGVVFKEEEQNNKMKVSSYGVSTAAPTAGYATATQHTGYAQPSRDASYGSKSKKQAQY